MNVDWICNPGKQVLHAWVHGPGSGDGSICGRAVLDPDGRWSDRGYQCVYCRRLVAAEEEKEELAAHRDFWTVLAESREEREREERELDLAAAPILARLTEAEQFILARYFGQGPIAY